MVSGKAMLIKSVLIAISGFVIYKGGFLLTESHIHKEVHPAGVTLNDFQLSRVKRQFLDLDY